ncbi:type IV secretory system conjugative DNA transfer family protein [Pseudomonas guariconensis]|uniref:type IV secretory system conjugative DNA transfer family protein n=1 Tax=Pseudomonas guariconensis TaxID=1288410 RepID=UPI0039060337
MAIRSARLAARETARLTSERARNIALSLPLIGAAIPFAPLPLTIAIAVGCAMWTLKLDRDDQEADKPLVWDRKYVQGDLEDCDFQRSTFLGKTMPWVEWKERIDTVVNERGVATADDVRQSLIEAYPSMIPFMLSDDIMTRHMALLAATGTGKTELILAIAQQQIKKGAGFLLVEAKADTDLSGAIYGMMEAAGRLDQFKLISFEFPEISHTYNPFFSGGARTTLSTAMKVQAASKEEFWTDVARYSLSAAILCMKLQPGEPAFHIKDMIAVLSDFDIFLTYVDAIREADSEDHKDGKEFLLSYLRFWRDEDQESWDRKKYKNLLQGTISKLSAFAHSEYSRIVNTYSPDVELKDAILNGEVVVLSMSALADQDGVALMGKLFISDLARAIGEIQLQKLKPLMICPAIFDEYGSFADESQITLFQLARSANVPIIIAFQGVGFLQQRSAPFVEMVLGNCWTQIYCDIRDAETRAFACKLAGTTIRKYEQESEGSSTGASHSSEQSGLIANENVGSSTSIGTKATREDLLQPDDFQTLDEGDGVIVAKSGTYRVRMPIVRNNFAATHFRDMKLCRRQSRGRVGIHAWDKFTKRNREILLG